MRPTQTRSIQENIPQTHLIYNSDGSVYHLGILEEHVADDIWIVGDPDRVGIISSFFDQVDFQIHRREFVLHKGILKGRPLTVVSSGIGVDNIEILISELDAAVNIEASTQCVKSNLRKLKFLRLGTCGTLRSEIAPGTIVASSFAYAYDGVPYSYEMEFSAQEEELVASLKTGGMDRPNLYAVEGSTFLQERYAIWDTKGITYTANGFYGPQGRSVRLKSKLEAFAAESSFEWNQLVITNIEMECAGLYAMASLLGHEALTCCVILANRKTQEFSAHPAADVDRLIQNAIAAF
jgi:uridine phosphorylase